jgi:hypothetical protein
MQQWRLAAKLSFHGDRFSECALDVSALGEVGQFQELVTKTAKALWRAANVRRERLPGGFEESTRLYLRAITPGSTALNLEERVEVDKVRLPLEAEPTYAARAIALLQGVYRRVEQERLLPEALPKPLVDDYLRWGGTLQEGEAIEIESPTGGTARLTPASRALLLQFAEGRHEAPVDLTGEVLEADVRQRRFQLFPSDGGGIPVQFAPEEEDQVTAALRDHRSIQLRVVGRGEYAATGRLLGVSSVAALQLVSGQPRAFDPSVPPIEAVIEQLVSEVPSEAWANLPDDLIENLDHYIYGTPKE